MVYCTRCRLCLAMRIVNMVVTLFGMGMIIYSLWLLKKWRDAVSELASASALPKPWFIYTLLGVGIIECLSTLVGHMVANRISISALSYANVLVLAIALWALGPVSRSHCHGTSTPAFRYSFLVGPDSQVNIVASAGLLKAFGS